MVDFILDFFLHRPNMLTNLISFTALLQMAQRFLAVAIIEVTLAWLKRLWWLSRPYLTRSPTDASTERILRLRAQVQNAKDYPSYYRAASALDRDSGLDTFKAEPASPYYDVTLINKRVAMYQRMREAGDIHGLMFYLRSHLMREQFGLGDPRLWNQCHVGTKTCLVRYVNEVTECMKTVRDSAHIPEDLRDRKIPRLMKKIDFFRETLHSFGHTALCLSGGAAMGMYHIGFHHT